MTLYFDLRIPVSHLIDKLQTTPAHEFAEAAMTKAANARTPQEILEIFTKFEKRVRGIESEDHHISDQLHTLLLDERTRIAETWRKRLRPQAPCLHISDLPSPAFAKIFQWLRTSDKANLFQAAAAQQMESMRETAFSQMVSTLFPLASDSEARRLYEVVFGESFPSPEIFQKRWEAERKKETEIVHQLNAEIAIAYRKLSHLKIEMKWSALPTGVKQLFGNIETCEILSTPASFISALIAIRAYNLVCVGKGIDTDFDPDLSTKERLIEAGEAVAKLLQHEGDGISILFLSSKGLTCLPLEVTNLTHLEGLFIDSNYLSTLPPQIGNLHSLTQLCMSFNHLTSLPPQIKELKSLKKLLIQFNNLRSIPKEIGKIENLEDLWLGHNRIPSLPPEIGNLHKLELLSLEYNALTSIPKKIEECTLLVNLSLANNDLTSLPKKIANFRSLLCLSLEHNPHLLKAPWLCEFGKKLYMFKI